MTLKVTDVGYAEYRKDGSVAFYVLCEGVSEVVETGIQKGKKNEYNNSILEAWLTTNTPDPYFTAQDEAAEAEDALVQEIDALKGLSPLDLSLKTPSELAAIQTKYLALQGRRVEASGVLGDVKEARNTRTKAKQEAFINLKGSN